MNIMYFIIRELTVDEGGSTPLTPGHLRVVTPYYADKITDYLLVDPPKNGVLVARGGGGKKNKKKNVPIFSVEDLHHKVIEVSEKKPAYKKFKI